MLWQKNPAHEIAGIVDVEKRRLKINFGTFVKNNSESDEYILDDHMEDDGD